MAYNAWCFISSFQKCRFGWWSGIDQAPSHHSNQHHLCVSLTNPFQFRHLFFLWLLLVPTLSSCDVRYKPNNYIHQYAKSALVYRSLKRYFSREIYIAARYFVSAPRVIALTCVIYSVQCGASYLVRLYCDVISVHTCIQYEVKRI